MSVPLNAKNRSVARSPRYTPCGFCHPSGMLMSCQPLYKCRLDCKPRVRSGCNYRCCLSTLTHRIIALEKHREKQASAFVALNKRGFRADVFLFFFFYFFFFNLFFFCHEIPRKLLLKRSSEMLRDMAPFGTVVTGWWPRGRIGSIKMPSYSLQPLPWPPQTPQASIVTPEPTTPSQPTGCEKKKEKKKERRRVKKYKHFKMNFCVGMPYETCNTVFR